MAVTNKNFSSTGGFSVDDVNVISDQRDVQNVNTFHVQNRHHTDGFTRVYIVRGSNTEVLTLDGTELITLQNNTMNFVTAHIVAADDNSGSGQYVIKIETAVYVDGTGNVSALSSLNTIIKDTIPAAQTWSIEPYDAGDVNKFSYTATKSGGVQTVTWIAHTTITTVAYA